MKKTIVFSSNDEIGPQLAKQLNYHSSKVSISRFPNGEQKVSIEPVNSKSVILIKTISPPVDSNFVETLLIISSLEKMGVKRIVLVIPWMGYSLQNKVFKPGEPASAEIIAKCLSLSECVKHVVTIDIHKASILQHFKSKTTNLSAFPLLANKIKSLKLKKPVLVAPDRGYIEKVKEVQAELNVPLFIFKKNRCLDSGEISHAKNNNAITMVKELNSFSEAIILDDGILTGSTSLLAAEEMFKFGIHSIYFASTHGLFINDAIEKLSKPEYVKKIIVTNTIPGIKSSEKVILLSISDLLKPVL